MYAYRFDYEKFNAASLVKHPNAPTIKLAMMLECITICLDMKEDYTADVINNALGQLIRPNIAVSNPSEYVSTTISPIIMRTSILASNKYEECKRFVWVEIIPALIKNEIWKSLPQIWDGIEFFVKKFISSSSIKEFENAIRSICSLPSDKLNHIIDCCKVVRNTGAKRETNELKKQLKIFLVALPADQKTTLFGDSENATYLQMLLDNE